MSIYTKLSSKYTLLFLLTTFCFTAQAQFIKNTGEIKDAVDGKTLFTLEDKTFIYAEVSEPLWYEISKRVVFDVAGLTADSTLSKGTVLYNDDLEPIGEVQAEVEVIQITPYDGFRKDEYRIGIVKGFCSTFDTYTNSLPESAISDALEGRGQQAQLLSEVMSQFDWEEETYGQYTASILRNYDENNYVRNVPFRIIIIWRGSNIMAILSQKDYIDGNKSKDQTRIIEESVYCTWFQRPNARLLEEIENIAFDYINFDEPGISAQ
ncbi:hypothetical protein [Phaeocystidibacter marisrubri]|uniref:Uncharacterized protein n=1 Tax=Phaeocystidibacter marisrubri TaxID=1577780 RepID=A0A6L3ZED8_9FLAO|nr:hypothetical protein [Phaeocystidibacter marisrubri]KAB2816203.1 hypothetical protein F8C82_10985 [Phaeocystidibacter marisrubri]GGH67838.1 hypothetical protein GCM10011318_07250 [Phaeocystidibacter marisrubri]